MVYIYIYINYDCFSRVKSTCLQGITSTVLLTLLKLTHQVSAYKRLYLLPNVAITAHLIGMPLGITAEPVRAGKNHNAKENHNRTLKVSLDGLLVGSFSEINNVQSIYAELLLRLRNARLIYTSIEGWVIRLALWADC